jgi:hypothetical protein
MGAKGRGLLGISLACALAGCAATGDDDDGARQASSLEDRERLSGGQIAGVHQFDSALLILGSCSAAKVGPNHLLTAADCVLDQKRMLLPAFHAGKRIDVTNAKLVGPELSKSSIVPLTVVKTVVPSSYTNDCAGGCKDAIGTDAAPNLALVVVAEATPGIPSARIDLAPARPGDAVVVTGYGCDNGSAKSYDFRQRVFKIQRAAVQPGSALANPLSGIKPHDPRYERLLASFVLTPGLGAGPTNASLCPGDGGGPLYRDDGTESVVVGVNAYADAAINYHTRTDDLSRFKIASWLKSFGAQVALVGSPAGGSAGGATGDGCAGLSYTGKCEGSTVKWCDGGPQVLECGKSGMACGWNAAKGYYDCIQKPKTPPADPCKGATWVGACEGNTLVYCDGKTIHKVSCGAQGLACGYQADAGFYACLDPDPCGGLSYAGQCATGVVQWCEEGKIQQLDCWANDMDCGWDFKQQIFNCLD